MGRKASSFGPGRRLTDCLRIFTACGGRGLRIAYGFLPDVEDEACGLFTDLDRIGGRRLTDCLQISLRIWGRRLADCLWIWTGFGGEGLRIVYGFFPDVEDEAYTDCLRIFTGCGGRGLRIVYGFGPDWGEKAYGLFTDFFSDLGDER